MKVHLRRRNLRAELEARLAWKIGTAIVGSMVSMTGIFAIIVGWIQP